jgi:hypothetical protein
LQRFLRIGQSPIRFALHAPSPQPARRGIADSLHQLGILAQDQGDLDDARRLQREPGIKEKLGDQSGIARSMHNLGMLAEKQGDRAEAFAYSASRWEFFRRSIPPTPRWLAARSPA